MKGDDCKLVVFIYVVLVFLIAVLVFIVGTNITGNVIVAQEDCDFNISCGYANWSYGMIYCLNESQVTSDVCFDITNDSVVLDLRGFEINGTGFLNGGHGIIINGYDNVTIGNGNIYNFDVGVFLYGSSSSLIENLTIYDNNAGILVSSSDYSEVLNVTLYNNSNGVNLASSDGNFLTNVISYGNVNNGVVLIGSNNSILSDIELYGNNDSLLILNSIGGDYGDILVHDNLNDGIYGSLVFDSSFDSISSYNNLNDGIVFLNSRDNSFLDVSMSNNSVGGFRMLYSDVNSLVDVVSFDNGLDGIYLDHSDTNSFLNVSSYGNQRGIYMNVSDANIFYGLYLFNNSMNSSVGTNLSLNSFYYNVSDDNWIRWDLGDDFSFSGGLDFDSNVDFGLNYVSVNLSGLPDNFNSSALINLDLSGVNIAAPKPFVDGAFCDTNVCNIVSFDNDSISFIVAHFTNYSFEQSICGDSYCSVGEDCSICSGDCGNCSGGSTIIVIEPDPMNDLVMNDSFDYGGGGTPTNVPPTNNDDENDFEFPWIWVYVGLGILVLVGVIFIVGLFVLRGKGEGIVVNVEKPKSFLGNMSQVTSTSGAKAVSAHYPANAGVVSYANSGIQKKVDFVNDVSSIRNYVQTLSRNPKARIKYLIDSGRKFAERGDYRNAKEIYRFIFEEYRGLKCHDEKLYWEIVRFRMMIRG